MGASGVRMASAGVERGGAVSSRFVVGADQVGQAGDAVAGAAREVGELADRVAAALHQVAAACGGGRLADAAWRASGAWPRGLAEVAEAGSALGRATHDAAEAYRLLEQRQAQRFAAGMVRGDEP